MYYQIPLKAVPSQQIVTSVGGQTVTITLRQLGGRQYFSASLPDKVLCENVLMVDRTYLICAAYLGFTGDFLCVDTQGTDSPNFNQWNSRFLLLWDDNAHIQ